MKRPLSSAGAILLAIAISSLPACDQASNDLRAPRVPATSVSGPGVVRGKVFFNGPAPSLPPLRNSPCCEGAPAELMDETFILNPDNTLANVVVYLEGGPRTDGKMLPMVTLDQKFCQYVPHVVGVVVGQTLRVTSSDPVNHNVHYRPKYSSHANHWMKTAGEFVDVTFNAAEFIRTGCDVHPWMSAQIAVLDNPFFSITGTEGTFEIANLPAGEYKLVAWHERYGRREQPLTIRDESPVTIDFTYEPPTSAR